MFFRHYLISNYGATDQKGVFKRVTDEITNMQEATEFITRLLDAAQLYGKLKKPDHTNWFGSQEIVNDLKTFNDLSAMVIYPVLLKGFSIYGRSEHDFAKLVKILLTFFFRSRTISKAPPTSLESLMNDICKEMRNDPHLQINWIKEKLQKSRLYPSNEKFKFDFSIFDANSKNAPYILTSLNSEMHREAGDATNMTKQDVSLEHIMPETLTNNEWITYIRDRKKLKNPVELKDFHTNYLWRIGNLTILIKPLPTQTNMIFSEKINMYKSDKAMITRMLNQWEDWDNMTIRERQKQLADIAAQIWTLSK